MLQFSKEKRHFLNISICWLYVYVYFTVITVFYELTSKIGYWKTRLLLANQRFWRTGGHFTVSYIGGLAWGLSDKESACQCRRHGFVSWSSNIPGKEMATYSSILDWKSPLQRSLVWYSPWGLKRIGHNIMSVHYHHHSGDTSFWL